MPLALGGILVALAGVIGAVALWWIADGRHDDTIADFARAPAGCDTTLTFERQGRYVVYVETIGAIERIDGDCEVEGSYSHPGQTDPVFELVIVDADGTPLALGAHAGIAYDADGYVGSSVASVQIDGPGRYVMRVASPVDDFVVAVGTDPDDAAGVLRLGAISVLIGGLVVGGTALVFAALRRDTAEPDVETVTVVWTGSTWGEAAGVPSGPKGIPGEALQPPQRLPWAPPRVDGQ